MRGLGAALGISLAAHVAAASGVLVGWPGAARDDQPGVIFAEIVYESSTADGTIDDDVQSAVAIRDPSIASIEMTHWPADLPIKSSGLPPATPASDSLLVALSADVPDPEPSVPAPVIPTSSPEAQLPTEPILARPPVVSRSAWVVPRHKPRVPSPQSSVAISDDEGATEAPTPAVEQTATLAPETPADPQKAGGRRQGVEHEAVVAALPSGKKSQPIRSDISAPEYASPALGNQPPKYPYAARRRGMEGRVVIEVVVDRAGTVTTAAVAVSSGHRLLDRVALAAVKGWVFHPARRGGRAVGATIAIPIAFALETESAIAQE
jgi:periplasmic protein TonB